LTSRRGPAGARVTRGRASPTTGAYPVQRGRRCFGAFATRFRCGTPPRDPDVAGCRHEDAAERLDCRGLCRRRSVRRTLPPRPRARLARFARSPASIERSTPDTVGEPAGGIRCFTEPASPSLVTGRRNTFVGPCASIIGVGGMVALPSDTPRRTFLPPGMRRCRRCRVTSAGGVSSESQVGREPARWQDRSGHGGAGGRIERGRPSAGQEGGSCCGTRPTPPRVRTRNCGAGRSAT
jgi:hypothetical protein